MSGTIVGVNSFSISDVVRAIELTGERRKLCARVLTDTADGDILRRGKSVTGWMLIRAKIASEKESDAFEEDQRETEMKFTRPSIRDTSFR